VDSNKEFGAKVRVSFITGDRTYGVMRVWHTAGGGCVVRPVSDRPIDAATALKTRTRRRRLPPDLGERQVAAVAANVLDRFATLLPIAN
jgi:putative transposase